MTEFIAYIFAALTLIAGAYIWVLKSANDQLKGGLKRLYRENLDLAGENRTLRAKARMK